MAANEQQVTAEDAPSKPDKTSLLERFGGVLAVDDFVDGFYDDMAGTKELAKFFARFDLKILKDRTSDYLVGEWGGPEFHGPDLFRAHAALHITTKQFDMMMVAVKAKLKKMKVPKPIADEVIRSIAAMKEPICDPDGRLHKELNERMAAASQSKSETVALNSMGFNVRADVAEAWAEAERQRVELKQKMAEARERRAQKQKEQQKGKQSPAAPAADAKAAPKEKPPAKRAPPRSRSKTAPGAPRAASSKGEPAAAAEGVGIPPPRASDSSQASGDTGSAVPSPEPSSLRVPKSSPTPPTYASDPPRVSLAEWNLLLREDTPVRTIPCTPGRVPLLRGVPNCRVAEARLSAVVTLEHLPQG